jgi:hypothetical protein
MSGSKAGFSVSITAVDSASKQIDAINRRIREMQAPAERLTKSLGKLADNTGITKLAGGMRNLARESFQAFENIGRMVAPLGAITGAASIAGIAKLASSFGDFGNKTANAANRAGMGVEQFLNLGNAARLAGSSSEAMSAGMTALKDNIFDFAAGRAAPMTIAAFNTLGVSTMDASGHIRSATEVLPDLAEALSKVKDPTQRATLEMLTLGAAGGALDPLLRLGAKGVAELTDKAKALYGVTDKQIAQAVEFHQKTEALTIATEGLGIAISADLLPVIGPVVVQMTKWIEANRDWIAQDIAGFITKVIPEIEAFATGANDVVQHLGGWKTLLEGIVAIKLGGWAVSSVAALTPLIRLLALIPGSGVTAGVLAAAGLGYLGFKGAEATGAGIAQAGQVGLTPAMMDEFGNPIGFKDAAGRTYTNDRAAYMASHQSFQGEHWEPPPAVPYKAGQILGDMNVTPEQYDAFKKSVAGIERARYDQMGGSSGRFAGRYQMGRDEIKETAGSLGVPVPTQFKFLHDPAMQERFFEAYTDAHHKALMASSATYRAMTPAQKLAVDGYAHNQGAAGAARWLETGQSGRDAFGTAGSAYSDAVRLNVKDGAGDNVDAVMARLRTAQGTEANVQGGTGTAGGPGATTTVKGSANVNIKLDGFPAGTKTSAVNSGDLFAGLPRVEHAMPLGYGP